MAHSHKIERDTQIANQMGRGMSIGFTTGLLGCSMIIVLIYLFGISENYRHYTPIASGIIIGFFVGQNVIANPYADYGTFTLWFGAVHWICLLFLLDGAFFSAFHGGVLAAMAFIIGSAAKERAMLILLYYEKK